MGPRRRPTSSTTRRNLNGVAVLQIASLVLLRNHVSPSSSSSLPLPLGCCVDAFSAHGGGASTTAAATRARRRAPPAGLLRRRAVLRADDNDDGEGDANGPSNGGDGDEGRIKRDGGGSGSRRSDNAMRFEWARDGDVLPRLSSSNTGGAGSTNSRRRREEGGQHPLDPPTRASKEEAAYSAWDVEYRNNNSSSSTDYYYSPPPDFPRTVPLVACAAAEAVLATWAGTERLDPNVAVNALRRSALDYRPVRTSGDVGRIGVEIDGARFLMLGREGTAGVAALPLPENDRGDGGGATAAAVGHGAAAASPTRERATRRDLEGRALRRVALMLAAELAEAVGAAVVAAAERDGTGDGRDDDVEVIDDDGTGRAEKPRGDDPERKDPRPTVAVYFNSLRQTLLASRELALLMHEERVGGRAADAAAHRRDGGGAAGSSRYGTIRILQMGQDDLPPFMSTPPPSRRGRPPTKSGDAGKMRHKWGRGGYLESGDVDPSRGIVVAVQPSDRHAESRPPGQPAPASVEAFQRVSAQAAVGGVPVVAVSPRLTEQLGPLETERFDGGWDHLGTGVTMNANAAGVSGGSREGAARGGGGLHQSSHQSSSTYGGAEPPRGPTPWILRDYTPPAYVWVGCALDLIPGDGSGRRPTIAALRARLLREMKGRREEEAQAKEDDGGDRDGEMVESVSYYSRLGLTHSVADAGRPWRVYAAEETVSMAPRTTTMATQSSSPSSREAPTAPPPETSHQYVACTGAAGGRPPRSVLRRVFTEWRR